MNTQTDTQAHGDAAAGSAIEPRPKNRFGLSVFTERAKPKPAPFVPKPLKKRTPRIKPVPACTVDLAPRKRTGPLPSRTTVDAAAMLSGAVVDAPGVAIALEAAVHPRGTDAAIAFLARHGIEPMLSKDAQRAWPRTPKRMDRTSREVWDAYGPRLIVARKRGETIECEHPGRHPKGVSFIAEVPIVGDVVFCYFHADGGE